MKLTKSIQFLLGILFAFSLYAEKPAEELTSSYIIKMKKNSSKGSFSISKTMASLNLASQEENLENNISVSVEDANFMGYVKVSVEGDMIVSRDFVETKAKKIMKGLARSGKVEYIQPNYTYSIPAYVTARTEEELRAEGIETNGWFENIFKSKPKNPEPLSPFPTAIRSADPLAPRQWALESLRAEKVWEMTKDSELEEIVVAVIDTGVDYNHEDLVNVMWRNEGEMGLDENGNDKSVNGIDDDGNGYIDDMMGWDFSGNDSLPYDENAKSFGRIIGGQPGHGTHVAGVIAAERENGKGISGLASNVKIMPIRFLGKRGQGDTLAAIKAIQYGVDNGAHILSNSWGANMKNPDHKEEDKKFFFFGRESKQEKQEKEFDQALSEAIAYAQSKGVLFVVASGNGNKQGLGFNLEGKTTVSPAKFSKQYDNVITVAAYNRKDKMGAFSNYSNTIVGIGAPGVKILSTVPENDYEDKVKIPFFPDPDWNGTSMATPYVSAGAALYLGMHPDATYLEVKEALYATVRKVEHGDKKLISGGVLDAAKLLGYKQEKELQ